MIILYGLLVLIAVITGYYLGNGERMRAESQKIKQYFKDLTENKEIKIIVKREPKRPEAEIIEELEKNNASQ